MRCKNCGWENPGGNTKCEKCNAPLKGSMVENNGPRESHSPVAEELKKTIPESKVHLSGSDNEEKESLSTCPKCDYPVSNGMNVCPHCGTALRKREAQIQKSTCPKCGTEVTKSIRFCPACGMQLKMGTVNAWERPQQGYFCTLKPVAWKDEEVLYNPISYSGEIISLNRANTDPNNNTITSKEQAQLIHEGDSWYIENRSEQQTTFIRVGKRTKLESGDVIILGNRLFEFKG